MVWVTSKVVATSTVLAAVVLAPPRTVEEPESPRALELKILLLALVKALPVATVRPVLNVPKPVTVNPPAEIVAPPLVTVRPVPIVALLVTARPVPAPVKEASPLKVFAPPMFWAAAVMRPGLELSAASKNKVEPVMVAPLAEAVPTAPMVLTPVPPVSRASQAEPFHIKEAEVLAAIDTPYIVKTTLPLRLLM